MSLNESGFCRGCEGALPRQKVAEAQAPGINGERRINSAGARQNAAISNKDALHAMYCAV